MLKESSPIPEAGAPTAAFSFLFYSFIYFFYCTVSVTDSCFTLTITCWWCQNQSCCSSWSQPLFGCSLFLCLSHIFENMFCSVFHPSVILRGPCHYLPIFLFRLKTKNLKITLANQCSSFVIPPVLFSLIFSVGFLKMKKKVSLFPFLPTLSLCSFRWEYQYLMLILPRWYSSGPLAHKTCAQGTNSNIHSRFTSKEKTQSKRTRTHTHTCALALTGIVLMQTFTFF